MKKAAAVVGILLFLLGAYLLLWPVTVDPVAWEPPVYAPDAWKPTGSVAVAERIEAGARGPEDVEVDAEGRIYVGVEDGRVLVFDDPAKPPRTFATTGGRPLGMHWANGRLFVADAAKGLLAIDPVGASGTRAASEASGAGRAGFAGPGPAGVVSVLTTTCAGTKLVFTDDVDVAADGTVYFTDASSRFGQNHWKEDLIENRPWGRLCTWNPKSYAVDLALGDLYFANGVAIDPAQQFVLVNETSRYRVRKLWIGGEKKGQSEMLIENLPGFPDNISTGTGGLFWIAIASPRNPVLDDAAGSPLLRKVIMRLPVALQPKPEKTARALGVDGSGRVVHDLFDPNGEKVFMVTAVAERQGQLYFGSLQDAGFARMPVPH